MNPDYIIISALVSIVCFFGTMIFFDTYEFWPKVTSVAFMLVAMASLLLGMLAPLRVTETIPANLHITKGSDMVLIQGDVDGQKIAKTNATAYFYNNVDKPGYKLFYRVRKSPFHILIDTEFILVKE